MKHLPTVRFANVTLIINPFGIAETHNVIGQPASLGRLLLIVVPICWHQYLQPSPSQSHSSLR